MEQQQIEQVAVPVAVTVEGLLDGVQAGKVLGVCRMTLYNLRKSGELAYITIGNRIRYSKRHLEDFKARNEQRLGKGR